MPLKYSLNQVQQYFIEHNAVYLNREYKGVNEKVEFRCSCGELSIYCSFSQLKRRNSKCLCRKCQLKIRTLSLKQVRQWFFDHNSEYLSEFYFNAHTPFKFKCSICGNPEIGLQFNLLKTRNPNCFCKKCGLENRSGSKNIHWNFLLSNGDRVDQRKILWYKEWQKQVFKVYNYTCVITGKHGIRLSTHHLYNYGHYPELRSDVGNGVTLLPSYHQEFHLLYGFGHNTLEQFQEFFLLKTQMLFKPLLDLGVKQINI